MLTDTARGTYSNRFRILEDEAGKDVEVEHAVQVAARDRVRRMSADTNRRRKALENKKKLEAQREAKRREQVLKERHQRQQEATNRYQRLNKGGSGQRQGNTDHGSGTGTPSLDEMLQMVGVPSPLSLKYGQGYTAYQHNGMPQASTYPATSHNNGLYTDSNANNIPDGTAASKGYPYPTPNSNTSGNLGRVDSQTSLFEQEIVAQQQQLIAQQHRTLQEFSQAIQNETSSGGGGHTNGTLHRSGSVSSVDSLEEQRDKQKSNSDLTQRTDHLGNQSRVPNDISNYSLYHNDVLMRGSYEKVNDAGHQIGNDGSRPPNPGVKPSKTSGTQSSPYNTSTYRTAKSDIAQEGKSASTQAWSQSKPSGKPPVPHHTSAPTATTTQRSRPYSALTTATAVTVAPAVSYGVRTQDLPSRQPAGVSGHVEQGYPGDSRVVSQASQGMTTPQDRAEPSTEEDIQEVSPPKSILKTHKGHKADTPAKEKKTRGLAAAIMRDSLEMGKLSGLRSQKKNVRWTDMNYSDDGESVDTQTTGTTTTTENAAHPRKPRLISGVSARTVQDRFGSGAETAVTTTPPRSRSGNQPWSKDRNSSVQIKNSRFANVPEAVQNQTEKERKSERVPQGPVMQNGIRLDKTPTDDEINCLWDKVRTCLHTSTHDDTPELRNGIPTGPTPSGKPPLAANLQEQRITANLRVAPPSNKPPGLSGNYKDTLRRQVTAPRWRTNSDSGTHAQQFQQRQRPPHVRTSSATRNVPQPQQVPEQSMQGPGRSRTVQQGPDMTDSLMAFQHAENLIQQNADDADIVAVIEQQQRHHPDKRVHPSALSIEEAKIMESLDRLNARLKTVTADMNGSFSPAYPVMHPRPPVYGGGFKGHRPVSSRPGPGGAGRSTLRARAHSADRYNLRAGQHR